MNRRHWLIGILGLWSLLAVLPARGSVVYVANAGFETAGTDSEYSADWNYIESGVHIGIGRKGWAVRTGDFGLVLYGWNAGSFGTAWHNDIAVDKANGNRYTFSIWALAEANFATADSFVNIKIELKNSSGTILEEQTVNIYNAARADPGNWNQHSVSIVSDNPDVAYVTPVIWSQNYASGATDPRGFFFDDAEVTQEWAAP